MGFNPRGLPSISVEASIALSSAPADASLFGERDIDSFLAGELEVRR
jgi:hypothetical protein